MKWLASLLILASGTSAWAASPAEIQALKTRAIVYLEVDNAAGQFIDSGSGFIVSHDGYVVTAAHVSPKAGETLWAVIGQRQGTRFPLEPRGADQENDVALWQLPQSASCHYAVTLATTPVQTFDRVVAIGFPAQEGLSGAPVTITNTSSSQGFYKADGFVRSGYSGGPVFNEDGKVIAFVHSGTPAGGNNDFVPIAFAMDLIRKRGVRAGINAEQPFDKTCFAFCRAPQHGIDSWTVEKPWYQNSGKLPGGHNRTDECKKLIAAATVGDPTARIDLDPGEGDSSKGMWEDVDDNRLVVQYTYHCRGTYRSGPVYKRAQSAACGLWE